MTVVRGLWADRVAAVPLRNAGCAVAVEAAAAVGGWLRVVPVAISGIPAPDGRRSDTLGCCET